MRYTNWDKKRIYTPVPKEEYPPEKYRTDYRIDCARLIHSPAFRRLQGKMQLFPNAESDFFRTRLPHSVEVAQVAKSIANRVNNFKRYSSFLIFEIIFF